ncbi:uncharacterized protein isoform X2 [Salmo salar]|uniref:Uncharacterized protein isoform X2 n=1 Tax=Salmo salar TaxID=8030 RepID=A0A1S3S2U4_SALSA|nr:uncharacterized protein LOC106606838 isoform X2 [Salmo salar]|eukprot:XP_014058690.1 PREDICTED: uncharacterized protein LOC106606838 isoform X3 [Salmo salar]
MSISYLFGLLLTILFVQGCWGGEETKNVSCASLRTGNAYKYCVKDKEKPKRVEWQSVDSNKTSMWLATWLCQNKDTTHTHNVIDVSYSCITLLECINVDHTAISNVTEHLTHFIVSGASDEPKELLEKEPDSQNSIADDVKQDVDNENPNHDNTHTWLFPVGVVALVLAIAGSLLVFIYVYKPWRDKQCNQGHREVEAGQGIPEPNSIPLMQNERRDASGQGVEDGKPSDNDRADTETCQKTHVDSPPLNVPKVVRVNSQTDDTQLLGQPQSNGHVPYRRESHLTNGAPGQGAGETPPLRPLLCRSPGEEGGLEGQDRKSADCGGTDPESCQKTHAEPPLVNGHHDVRVNDGTKEVTPGAQSPGPPQMNGGPPMSNRAAEETTALLDKQALDKDQVTKPPELIDKGPNDMESRRGEL